MNWWRALRLRLANWREWELNPIVIKELRQSVRSWAVMGMLMLFLSVLFATALLFLVSHSFDTDMGGQLGMRVFASFMGILTFSSLTFIPLYIGIRLAAERQENNLDLLYVTTLTPGRIIRGKFLCGAYMALLFFSACMPFMVFTTLLRGVDVPSIALGLVQLFCTVCVAIQVAIFLSCLALSRFFKILLALGAILILLPTMGPLMAISMGLLTGGVGSMIGGADFWNVFLTWAGVMLGMFLMLYFLSVALISPPSMNRALPLRIYVTLVWAVSGALCLGLAWVRSDPDLMTLWHKWTLLLLSLALVLIVSGSDDLSFRVRRTIPSGTNRRVLAFLFYNGAAGGLVWAGVLASATIGLLALFLSGRGALGPNVAMHQSIEAATILYAFAYSLTALFVHRRFFRNRPGRLAGVLAVLLPGLWAVMPVMVLFFLNRLSFKSVGGLQLGNLFNLFWLRDMADVRAHLWFAAGWLLLMLLLNAKWFMRCCRDFEPVRRVTLEAEHGGAQPPPVPTGTNVLES